jgi:glycine/D-amino acid oxidase-like deaminating enzyme
LQYEIDTPLHKLALQIGEKSAVRSYKLCEEAITKLMVIADTIGFKNIQPKKSLYFTASPKDLKMLKEEFDIRKRTGFKVSWLNEKAILRKAGFKAAGAILSSSAAQTDAYLFTHALHRYGIRKGLEVYDRTEVTSIKHTLSKVILTTNTGHRINAKKLVYATGYETGKYLDKHFMQLHSTYAIVSEVTALKKSALNGEMIMWNTANPYLYLRTTTDNRIIIGGRDENFYAPLKRDKLIASKSHKLAKDFKKLFPAIPFITEFSWAGTFCSTKDGLPFIGPYKKLPNGYFALGFGGNGITFSQIAAEMITNMLRGKETPDAALFSFDSI